MPELPRLRVLLLATVAWWMPARGRTEPAAVVVEAPRRIAEAHRSALPITEVIDAETLLRRGGRDVGDALATLAGVQVVELPDGRRQLVVHGWMSRALLCVDARPVTRGADGTVDVSELPATMDEVVRVELVREPMSHVYGSGAEGGLVNVVTRVAAGRGVSATVAGRGVVGGRAGFSASGAAAYSVGQGGVHAHGSMADHPGAAPWETGRQVGRRMLGAGGGGTWRLHPRVVARAETWARSLELDPGITAERSTRRVGAAGDMVTRVRTRDAVHVELRGGVVESRWHDGVMARAARVFEQVGVARYVGEPLKGHLVTVEAGAWAEWVQLDGHPYVDGQRLRVHGTVGDRWVVSRTFAVEGAARVETTDRLRPALAPSLSFRYEPFRHLFVRASASGGYRYPALRPGSATLPEPASVLAGRSADHESARHAHLGAAFEPGPWMHVGVDVFRTELAASDLALQTGALAVGFAFGQFQAPGLTSAHVQGLRGSFHAARLPGDLVVDAGYQYLQEATDDVLGKRLPLVARHSLNWRTAWEPRWLAGLRLQAAVEALADRVDAAGRALPAQGRVHLGAGWFAGPLTAWCALENAVNVVEAAAGPRDGRSARCAVRGVY